MGKPLSRLWHHLKEQWNLLPVIIKVLWIGVVMAFVLVVIAHGYDAFLRRRVVVVQELRDHIVEVDLPYWIPWGERGVVYIKPISISTGQGRRLENQDFSEDTVTTAESPAPRRNLTLIVTVRGEARVDFAHIKPAPAAIIALEDGWCLTWNIAPSQGLEPISIIEIPFFNDRFMGLGIGSTIITIGGRSIQINLESPWWERGRTLLQKSIIGASIGAILSVLLTFWNTHLHKQFGQVMFRELVQEVRNILNLGAVDRNIIAGMCNEIKNFRKSFRAVVQDPQNSSIYKCIECLVCRLFSHKRQEHWQEIPCPWSEWATEISRPYVTMTEKDENEGPAYGSGMEVQLTSWLLQQDWRVLDPDTERDLRDTIARRFSQITSSHDWRQWKERLDTRRPNKTTKIDAIAEMPNLFPEPGLRAEDLTTRWWLFAKGLFWEPGWLSLSKVSSAAFNLVWGPAGQGHTAAALAVGRYRNPPQALGLYFLHAPTFSRIQRALAEQVLEFLMTRAPDLWRLDRAQRTLLWHWLASVLPVASLLARLESARQAWWARASDTEVETDDEEGQIRARYADAVLRMCQAEVPEFRAWAPLPDDVWWNEGRTVLHLVETRLEHTFQAVWLAWDDPRPSGSSAAEEVPWLSLRERLQTMGLDLRVWWFVPSAEEPRLPQTGAAIWQRIPMRWTADDLRGLLEHRLWVLRPITAGHLETAYDPGIVAWWLRERPGCTLRDFVQRWQATWQEAQQEVQQVDDDVRRFERLKEAFRVQFARWGRCA